MDLFSQDTNIFQIQLFDELRVLSDPAEIQSVITHKVMDYYRSDRCYYGEVEEEMVAIPIDAHRENLPSVAGKYSMVDMPVFKHFLYNTDPIIIEDIQSSNIADENLKKLCIDLKILAYINVPVVKNGQIKGVFGLTQRLPRKWTEQEVGVARFMAELTWSTVEKAKSQRRLARSEDRLRMATEASDMYWWELDFETNIPYYSPNTEQVIGASPAKTMQDNLLLIHPDDREITFKAFNDAIKNDTNRFGFEVRSIAIPDEIRWFYVSGKITLDKQNNPAFAVGISQNITQRKKAEEAIRLSEEHYRIALEAGELATWDWNTITNKIVWNDQHYRLFGIDHHEDSIEPEYFLEFIYPEDLAYVKKELYAVTGTSGVYSAEFRIRRRDNGEVRWMSGYGRVTKRENGKPTRISGVMIDTTERRQAENNLAAAQNTLHTALEAAKMGIWSMNLTWEYIDHSSRHDELLGYASWQQEWSIEKAKMHLIEEDKEEFDKAYNKLLTDGVFELEARVKKTDGNICWIYYYGRVFKDDEGKPESAAGVIFDITDRKGVDKQKDDFIGIASHELKTPVTSIKIYAEILEEIFAKRGDVKKSGYMKTLEEQVDRLTTLINMLLDTSRINEGELALHREVIDINDLVSKRVEELRSLTHNHRLIVKLCSYSEVSVDTERLNQVFTNLISNAFKYSPKGGDIIIECESLENEIRISVKDKGIGIPESVKEKVFDRFFRTEETKAKNFPGMGLGLYITAAIVRRHGGKIWVESEVGKGSTFYFTLPLNPEPQK